MESSGGNSPTSEPPKCPDLATPCPRRPRKRGPYKQYFVPGSHAPIPKSTKYCQRQDGACGTSDGAVLPCLATNVELPHESEDATVTHSLQNAAQGQARGGLPCEASEHPSTLSMEPGSSSEDFTDNASCSDDAEHPCTSPMEHGASPDDPIEDYSSDDARSYTSSVLQNHGAFPDDPTEEYSSDDARSHTSSVAPSDEDISDEDAMDSDPQGTQAARNFAELFQGIVGEQVVVSKGDILVMLLKYVASNNLSFTGLTNLVKMVNSFFSKPILPDSRYFLSKMFGDGGATFHFYCPHCFFFIGKLDNSCSSFQCSHCSRECQVSNVSEPPFFLTFNVQSQLQGILKNSDFLDLTEPLGDGHTMGDITDGSMYRTFVNETAEAGHRISVTLNADGAPVFKSSSTSIWPIQLSVNEIPPKDRMNNLVLAALWFGKSKPRMDIFQKAFVDMMQDLSETGFPLSFKGKTKTFRAFCICAAVDSVARAPMQGIMQFNGYFGCNWCLHPGTRIGRSLKYPVQTVDPDERTDDQMYDDMQKAFETGTVVRGVKTVSPLINLEHFSIVWGFVPDYMHCVLLGVARQFLEHWLECCDRDFYIGREIDRMDSRLLAIKPPRDVRRMPRSLRERKFWKAKELESWVLYYSIPVLHGLLPTKYVAHWALLVEAVHLMLQQQISSVDIELCDLLMLEFVVKTQLLYGEDSMTFNIHQMEHIVKSVRLWGPLWAHSAFPFEAGNGKMKTCIKAAKGIPHQICRMLAAETVVSELEQHVTSAPVSSYCCSLSSRSTQKSVSLCTEGVRLLGRGCPFRDLGGEAVFSAQAVEYPRMVKDGTVFTTASYVGKKKSNSSAVKLTSGLIGVIEKIVFDKESSFLILKPLECTPFYSKSKATLFKVHGRPRQFQIARSSEIFSAVVYMGTDDIYVAPVPSAFTF